MFGGVKNAPSQGWNLAARDIRIEYIHTKMGLFWAFIEPLAIAGVFIALRSNGSLEVSGLNMPFSLFAVSGILIWQTFFDSLMMSLTSLQRASGLIGNYSMPPESLMMAMVFRSLFLLVMRLPIILGLAAAQGLLEWQNALLFIAMSPICSLGGVALGLFLAPFTLVSGDLKLAVGVIGRPMLYLSGAVFPLTGGLAIFKHGNPIALTIEDLRFCLLSPNLSHVVPLLYVALGILVLSCMSWFAYHRTMRAYV
jgi:lipopolysaccharide transport system permease protein